MAEKKFQFLNTSTFVLAVFLLSVLTRISLLDSPLVDDEYFHVLVGESWWKDRQLSMLDGFYGRGDTFTKLVALSFDFFDDTSWRAARIFPSLVAAILTICLLSWWVCRELGQAAGLFFAALLIFWPDGIEVSQFARFYALHGFLFSSGIVLFYYACVGDLSSIWWRLVAALASAIFFFLALDIQVLTVGALAGVGLWFFFVCMVPWLRRLAPLTSALVVIIGIVVVATVIFAYRDVFTNLWSLYRTLPPGWDFDPTFYHRHLRDAYPTFWPAFVLTGVVAAVYKPKLAFLCLLLFLSAFVMLSVGHRVHLRYLYHVTPFLFVIWAICFSLGYKFVGRFVVGRSRDFSERFSIGSLSRPLTWGITALICAFLIFSNPAFPRSIRLALGATGGELLGDKRVAWPEAWEMVYPWAEKGALLITSRTMISIAYLGDFDVAYSRLSVHDIGGLLNQDDRIEAGRFIVDPRDGRPLIGTQSELLRLIECTPLGVAIAPVYNSDFVKAFGVAERELPIETKIEEGKNVRLFIWRSKQVPEESLCADLPIPEDGGAAHRIVSGQSAPAMGPNRP